jgi:hypothetical protein
MNDFSWIFAVLKNNSVATIVSGLAIYAVVQVLNIFLDRIKARLTDHQHIKDLEKRDDVDLKVQELLNNTLENLPGDRLLVFEFTNTVKNIALLPFKYMTCTYESYKPDKKPVSQYFQNLLTTHHSIFLSNLHKNGHMIMDINARDHDKCGSSYGLLDQRGALTSLNYIIRDKHNRPIGFLAYDYFGGELEYSQEQEIKNLARDFGIYLSLSKTVIKGGKGGKHE